MWLLLSCLQSVRLQVHKHFQTKKGKDSYLRVFLGSFLNGNVCRRFNISHKLKKIHLVPEMLYNVLRREAGKNIA